MLKFWRVAPAVDDIGPRVRGEHLFWEARSVIDIMTRLKIPHMAEGGVDQRTISQIDLRAPPAAC